MVVQEHRKGLQKSIEEKKKRYVYICIHPYTNNEVVINQINKLKSDNGIVELDIKKINKERRKQRTTNDDLRPPQELKV